MYKHNYDMPLSGRVTRSLTAFIERRTAIWHIVQCILFSLMVFFVAKSILMLIQGIITGNWQPLFAHPIDVILGGGFGSAFGYMVGHSARLRKPSQPETKLLLEEDESERYKRDD